MKKKTLLAFLLYARTLAGDTVPEPDGQPPLMSWPPQAVASTDSFEVEVARLYNNKLSAISDAGVNGKVVMHTHWQAGVAGLPTGASDAVIVGTAVGAEALVSEDQRAVFSRYRIRVSDVLKGVHAPDDIVVATRPGGRVRFASGTEALLSAWFGMGSLVEGERYLVFLKRIGTTTTYELVTGYRLDTSGVVALDSYKQFQDYNGVTEETLLARVRSNQ